MPKPLSTTLGICLGYAALGAYAHNGSAVSAEAGVVRQMAYAVVESAERSEALFGWKAVALSQLAALAGECGEAGWDGDRADGIDPMAIATASDLVRALPNDISMPEFAPEPDGSVSFDWIQSRHRRFTLSVGGSDRLAYAWCDGTDKGHGVARFDGVTVPSRVLEGVRSIVNHEDASLRAA